MGNTAIRIENISKQYMLGSIGTGTLIHDLNRWWAMNIQGKPDEYRRVGYDNVNAGKGNEYVWALKDINFDVAQGDAIGIVGRNGAGKSTLLKILSRTTSPTTGSIKIKGRMASLLEIGTGFDKELTGRQNIYQNGAILGMRKAEITQKMAEIIDFSGCERYIDTPVKRYSSGMYVRLAFAVAAHLESEILIVDEVLAVGDAEFQKKCLGKMNSLSREQGRTLLFVSHNLSAMKQLCNKAVLLQNGSLAMQGTIDAVAAHYIAHDVVKNAVQNAGTAYIDHTHTPMHRRQKALMQSVILMQNGANTCVIDNNTDFFVAIEYEILENIPDFALHIYIINASNNECVVHSSDIFFNKNNTSNPRTPADYISKMMFRGGFLNVGSYKINVLAEAPGVVGLFSYYEIIDFEVRTLGEDGLKFDANKWQGALMPSFFEWTVAKK